MNHRKEIFSICHPSHPLAPVFFHHHMSATLNEIENRNHAFVGDVLAEVMVICFAMTVLVTCVDAALVTVSV